MLMNLWPGYWGNQWESKNKRVDDDNGSSMVTVIGRISKVWQFSIK